MGERPARSAGLSSAAVKGLLLPGQRHLVGWWPGLALHAPSGTAWPSAETTKSCIQGLGCVCAPVLSSRLQLLVALLSKPLSWEMGRTLRDISGGASSNDSLVSHQHGLALYAAGVGMSGEDGSLSLEAPTPGGRHVAMDPDVRPGSWSRPSRGRRRRGAQRGCGRQRRGPAQRPPVLSRVSAT